MRRITLQRFGHGKVTFGKLFFDWSQHADIYTIELPWLENQNDISCIPEGVYICNFENNPERGKIWRLSEVKDRSGILIHSGNFACDVVLSSGTHKTETKGCIMPGMVFDPRTPMVQKSKQAIDYLYSIIGEDEFELEVKNA